MAKVTRLTLDSSGGLERRRLHLREISDDADAPLETVGQDLRKARQRKGEDLAHISAILKIRKDHLDALEESNFGALPGRAYMIGFVRTYAEYLGLDAAACVERLKTEIAGRGDNREGTVQMSSPRERWLPPGGIVFAILLGLAVAYGAYYLFVSVNRLGAEPVTPVPARLAAQAGLTPNPPAPPATPPIAQAAATPAPVVDPPAPAPAAPAAAPLPEGHKYGAQNVNSRITLVAHKPARATVLGADKRLFLDRILQPGDSYVVPNIAGLTLSTTDGGALELLLDGNAAGYAGKEGAESQSLSLNPQDVAEREAHG